MNNDIFILIIPKQILPVINGGSIKLRPMLGIHCFHAAKLCKLGQLFGATLLVGDKAAATQEFSCCLAKNLGPPQEKRFIVI